MDLPLGLAHPKPNRTRLESSVGVEAQIWSQCTKSRDRDRNKTHRARVNFKSEMTGAHRMSALCQKRTSGKLSQWCCQHSKAAGQMSNQRLCLRPQRGLGLHRWVVEPARPCPSAQEGTCSVRPRKKLTVPLAVLRQINCQPGRKKAVAFDRDQIVGPSQ